MHPVCDFEHRLEADALFANASLRGCLGALSDAAYSFDIFGRETVLVAVDHKLVWIEAKADVRLLSVRLSARVLIIVGILNQFV